MLGPLTIAGARVLALHRNFLWSPLDCRIFETGADESMPGPSALARARAFALAGARTFALLWELPLESSTFHDVEILP